MAFIEMDFASGGGGETIPNPITPNGSINTSNLSVSGTRTISGEISVTTRVATGGTLFNVYPLPSQSVNSTLVFATSSSNTRAITINTDGSVVLTGAAIEAGYSWKMNFTYNYVPQTEQ